MTAALVLPVPTPGQVYIPKKCRFLLDPLGAWRYRGLYGGRGGMKSWQMARSLLLKAVQEPLRILNAREYQSSIRDSSYRLLADQVQALSLGSVFDVQRDGIFGVNGSEFIFKGLRRDIGTIKSTEGIDICWVEEAQAVSDASWETLIPTIRKPRSEIWVSFNPGEPTEPTWQRFVVHPPPRSCIVPISYLDNPWLSPELKEEAETLRRRDPEAYAHIWGGEPWKRSELQVFLGKYQVEDFTPQAHWSGPYYGADWGFSRDPSVLVRLFIADGRLYISAETGGVQLDMDDLARKFAAMEGAREHRIYADAARPETINEMKRRGFNVVGAPKWSGSVKDGIEYLRGQFDTIVIHPSCGRAIEEARLYRYEADKKTGDPLPKLAPGNDHTWDAVRYALSPLIRRGPRHEIWFPGMTTPAEE